MRRGTTPTVYCFVKGADLTGKNVYATIKQGGTEITIIDPQCTSTDTGCTLVFTLTQAQTLKLKKSKANIQLRWIDNNGIAAATPIKEFVVDQILKEGEIQYE